MTVRYPLRSVSEINHWVEERQPSAAAVSFLWAWVKQLEDAPWQAPSVPEPDLSMQPDYEVRFAVLFSPDRIEIYYRQEYVTSFVDVLFVS